MASISANGKNGHHKFTLNVTETGTNASSNTSSISWSFVISAVQTSWDFYTIGGTIVVNINGKEVLNEYKQRDFDGYNATTWASGTTTVEHNSDGTKSIDISFSYSQKSTSSYTPGNASASGSMTLTKINRYFSSTPTLTLTGRTETTASFNWSTSENASRSQYKVGNGSWVDVETGINKKSGSFTVTGLSPNTSYTIYGDFMRYDSGLWAQTKPSVNITTFPYPYVTGSNNFTVGDNNTVSFYNQLGRSCSIRMFANGASDWYGGDTTTGTSISGYNGEPWRNYWYAACPNGTQNTYKVKLTNNTGGTTNETGYNYTYYIREDYNNGEAKPTFGDFTCKDTNSKTLALTGDNSKVILGYSTIQATIPTANKASANKYASMKQYKMVIGNHDPVLANYSSSSDVSLSLSNVQSNTVSVYAIDSRGFTNGKTKTLTNVGYSIPVLDAVNAKATRSSNGIGDQVTLTFGGTFWNNNFGAVQNKIKNVKYKYKKTDAKDYGSQIDISDKVTYNGNNFSINTLLRGDLENYGFDISDSYNVVIEFEDELHKISFSLIIPSGSPNIALAKNGVAIMQKYDKDLGGALQVNGKIYSKNQEIQTICLAQMYTYNSSQSVPNGDTQFVTGWGTSADISWGGIYCDPSNDRIVVPAGTAEYLKLSGKVAGHGCFWAYITIYDEDGEWIGDATSLQQPYGQGYINTPIPHTIIKLNNPNKMHYVKLKINGYGSAFGINYGFGRSGTFILVEKVK